jgi:hypothetical protein
MGHLQRARGAIVPCRNREADSRIELAQEYAMAQATLEKPRITDWQEGPPQSESQKQAPYRLAMDDTGDPRIENSCQRAARRGVISLKLERPEAAIRSKAQREGISLRPVNRSLITGENLGWAQEQLRAYQVVRIDRGENPVSRLGYDDEAFSGAARGSRRMATWREVNTGSQRIASGME